MRAGDRAGDDLGELARVVVRVAPLDGDEHVHPLGARRLRERDEPERVEGLLDEQRNLHRLGEADVGRRVEVEEDEVGPVGLVDARIPDVHVDARHVHHPEQRVLVADDRGGYPLAATRRLARRHVRAEARDPVRHVRGRGLLEERLAGDAVGVAAHRERPIAQVRDDVRGDLPVVLEHVRLRDPLVGPEDLVRVRERHPAALGDDLARGLVVSQPLEHRGAELAVVRPLDERDLAHELRLDPRHVAPAHFRHLRGVCERHGITPKRLEPGEQVVDQLLAEAGADVPDPLQPAVPVDAEDE